jgi:hypothetical protein
MQNLPFVPRATIGQLQPFEHHPKIHRNGTLIPPGAGVQRSQARIRSTGQRELRATESAVMASEIEALPDRAGYLKLGLEPVWTTMELSPDDVSVLLEPFLAGQMKAPLRSTGRAHDVVQAHCLYSWPQGVC